MPSVDNRVVQMEFNNQSFEQRVSATIASLARLKDSLNFGQSTKNLADLQAQGSKFNLEGIGAAVEGISSKFNAMGAVAFTVISNITSQAMGMAAQLVKSFALTPIIEGFQEYETNMNSIQVIMSNTASKGTNMDQITSALDELNRYADMTIYNFAQMAKNVGTFTAAGVDLDASVSAIKGIANLAAMSGSSADQASTAMYQLSQAIAAGSVKLMDWNSVVNAGMGGETFKSALFETAKAMGTLKNIPMDQTFAQWEDAGNSFRETLQDGWVTADVLTTTLAGFTGDLTEEMLLQKGYTQDQATQIVKTAALAKAAATDVKTFTQLMSTVKESIQTGWADSFKIVVGNFTEAKALFTSIYNSISSIIGASADARNTVLQGWKELGGRDLLIESLKTALSSLGKILNTVKAAFQSVFPPQTAQSLFGLTQGFSALVNRLIPTEAALAKLKSVFQGFFSIFAIGWEVIKGVAGVFSALFSSVMQATGATTNLAKVGDAIFNLKTMLVDSGKIADFFGNIAAAIRAFFDGLKSDDGSTDLVTGAVDRIGERFGWLSKLGTAFAKVWSWIVTSVRSAKEALAPFFDDITNALKELGKTISDALSSTDFSGVLDILNTGLFAVIALAIRNFVKNGLKFDIGSGFFENLSNSFEQLTGVLQGMEKNLKAEALLKIAKAIGLITISLLVLSLIDSGALTKALIGMAVAFGLMGAMLLGLSKITSGMGSGKILVLTGALILLAAAVLILSVAVKVMSTLGWDELLKGLLGVAALLAMVTLALKAMPNSLELVSTGVGLIGIALAIRILANAVQILGAMDIKTMIQGLIGIGLALVMIVVAIKNLPSKGEMVSAGVGILLISVALNILAFAVEKLGNMDVKTMIQGLIGIGLALVLIVVAVKNMPKDMAITAAGLLLIGISLVAIAGAIAILGNMDLGKMFQGLTGIGIALLALGLASAVMQGNILGAVAMAIMAASLLLLSVAVGSFAGIEWDTMLKGLVALVGVIAVLAIASALLSPVIPAMMALSAAIILLGAGIALLGVGAYLFAEAFRIITETGTSGIDTLIQIMDAIIMKIPEFVVALGTGLIQITQMFLDALPGMISQLGESFIALIQALRDSFPVLFPMITELILGLLQVIRDTSPEWVATGFQLLMDFLSGLKDNIWAITDTVVQIILQFMGALGEHMAEISAAGLNLLTEFLKGIASGLPNLVTAMFDVITAFVEGITNNIQRVIDAGGDLIVKMIEGVSNNIQKIIDAGGDATIKFIEGLASKTLEIINAAAQILVDFLNGLAEAIRTKGPEIRAAAGNVADALLDGIKQSILDGVGGPMEAIRNLADRMIQAFKDKFIIFSPSRVMMEMGGYLVKGLSIGLDKNKIAVDSAGNLADRVIETLNESLTNVALSMETLEDFNPTITPVLDLTKVEQDVGKLNQIVTTPKVEAKLSFDNASQIAVASREQAVAVVEPVQQTTKEIKFEQTINAPTALTTAEIYRNTRNQIALAKRELNLT